LVLRYRPQIFFTMDLRITFHENTSTMVSLSRKGKRLSLRIHRLFTRAPTDVLEVIVRCFFTRPTRRQTQRWREQIFDFLEKKRLVAAEQNALLSVRSPRGQTYNLDELQEEVRGRFFTDCRPLDIGWAPRVTSSLMAKWIATPPGTPNVIVVNPLLDDARVPRYYLEYIVFHELLHEVIPIRRERGRWLHHSAEFRRREREFPQYERALRWESHWVGKLFQAHTKRVSAPVAALSAR